MQNSKKNRWNFDNVKFNFKIVCAYTFVNVPSVNCSIQNVNLEFWCLGILTLNLKRKIVLN